MRSKITHTLHSIGKAFVYYPMVLTSSLVFLLAVQGMIDSLYGESFVLTKIAFTSSLGISLFFGLTMLGERVGKKWLWNTFALIFLLLFYFFILPDSKEQFTEMYVFVLIPGYILTHLLVAIAPFLSKHPDEQGFWHYNKTLFVHFFLTLVFTGVLAGGVQLALLAMNHLFLLGWEGEIYMRVFLSLITFGSVLIFCLFNVAGLQKMEAPTPYPIVIQFFTQFILIPLLLLYASILYIYGLKILWTWELPRGWVSYLVLAYGVLGILALLLVHPLLSGAPKSWVSWFRRLFYYSLLPLLVLLFAAISTRIEAYGFTEARYFVLLLAIWLSFIALYFIINKQPLLKMIPITLFFVGIASLTIPYVNTFSISINSQKRAFLDLLQDNKLLADGKLIATKPTPNTLVQELQDKYSYLVKRNQQNFLWETLNEDHIAELKKSEWNFRNLFENIIYADNDIATNSFQLTQNSKLRGVSGYTHIVDMDYENEIRFSLDADSIIIQKTMYDDQQTFTISVNGDSTDLLPLIQEWAIPFLNAGADRRLDSIIIPFQSGKYEGKLFPDQISIRKNEQDYLYYIYQVQFLLRKAQKNRGN